ncbi:MAG: hypothetical protein HOG49_36540 [Candidatus Scalindua sp.]|jgi:hypothetical protein|nr:hypothetical protein [Candidatus Scalindua sp.]
MTDIPKNSLVSNNIIWLVVVPSTHLQESYYYIGPAVYKGKIAYSLHRFKIPTRINPIHLLSNEFKCSSI